MNRTCLDVAAHCGQAEVVQFLFGRFEGQDRQPPRVGPLHWASKEGHVAVCRMLLE
jgi:ankyrin repeat protein